MLSINQNRPEEDVHTYVSARWLHITLRANMHSRLRRRPFIALSLVVMSTYSIPCELQVHNPQETRRYTKIIVSLLDEQVMRNVSK